jgi:hypothetical protein
MAGAVVKSRVDVSSARKQQTNRSVEARGVAGLELAFYGELLGDVLVVAQSEGRVDAGMTSGGVDGACVKQRDAPGPVESLTGDDDVSLRSLVLSLPPQHRFLSPSPVARGIQAIPTKLT